MNVARTVRLIRLDSPAGLTWLSSAHVIGSLLPRVQQTCALAATRILCVRVPCTMSWRQDDAIGCSRAGAYCCGSVCESTSNFALERVAKALPRHSLSVEHPSRLSDAFSERMHTAH